MSGTAKVRTCLWFERDGHRAAAHYVSLLPDSRLETEVDPTSEEAPLVVEFTLAGSPYMILTAGPHYRLTPAASISISTVDQAETDRLWTALLAGGGRESRCGWLVDRWGLSWQIVPEVLPRLLGSPDRAAAGRAHGAMMAMVKRDIATLEKAFDGD
jgi:predicted 3-demethylubiquinone-9 3-methyltransferase (glyoxalase superfamily)